MPAQPLPATGTGEFVIRYFPESHHVRATLLRRASTGALVELGTERVSYALTQDALAGEDPSVPYSDELGFVGDVEELGALGSRIKKAAKKIAKSKLGKIARSVGKVALSFVPGGSAVTGTIDAAKMAAKGVKTAKKVVKKIKGKPRPRPAPVYVEPEPEQNYDLDAASEEVGAAAPRKPAPKKPAPKPAARKPAPKAAPKPKPKPKAAAKPKAKPAPKAAPKPKPKPKAAAKPKAKPAAKPKAAKPGKPTTSAASKLIKVRSQGGAAATLAKSAAAAPTAAKRAQATKLAALVDQIQDDAPELAATLAELPETDTDDRDGVQVRAVAAAQKLAATPPAERAAMAATLEKRIDGYKVEAPDGTVIWVPMEEVDGGSDDDGGSDYGGSDDDEEE
jgi:hypothetical protein